VAVSIGSAPSATRGMQKREAVIDLYTYETPNGQKASVMLEEVGVPYVVHGVDLMKGEQRAPDFLRISPNNKIPAIVDDEGPDGPTTIFESGAILVYLGEKTGKLLPANGRARPEILQWLFWAMSGVGPGIGRFAGTALFSRDPDPALVRSLSEEVVRLFTVLDKRLSEVEYLAGSEFTSADIMICFSLTTMRYFQPYDLARCPNIVKYLGRISARPAYRRAMEKGDPGMALLLT